MVPVRFIYRSNQLKEIFEMKTFKVCKKAKFRNQYNQVPHLTEDTVWESDKNTTKRLIPESKEVSPFSAGDNTAARHRHDNMAKTIINKKKIHK